jgi:hypothetical protein
MVIWLVLQVDGVTVGVGGDKSDVLVQILQEMPTILGICVTITITSMLIQATKGE